MICSSFKINGVKCTFKAKYAINVEDDRLLVCGHHVLKEARILIDHDLKNIEGVSEIAEIVDIKKESDNRDMLMFNDVLILIKSTTGLDIVCDEDMTKREYGNEYKVQIDGEELILMICFRDPTMNDMYEAMCIQFETRHCNVFLPIKEFESFGRTYFISKMVHVSLHEKDDNQKIKLPYFYQVISPSTSIGQVVFDKELLRTFSSHMCDLIERMHTARMCFGDFNINSIVLLDPNDPTTAYIKSARNISFWINTNGEFKSEDRVGSGTKYPATAARRVHAKNAPSRYDDFESLLYLLMVLQNKIVPWFDSTTIRELDVEKNAFLKNPETYFEPNAALTQLCDLILNAQYEERPIYKLISKLMLDVIA